MSYSNLFFFAQAIWPNFLGGLKVEKYPLKNSKLDYLAKIFSDIRVKNNPQKT